MAFHKRINNVFCLSNLSLLIVSSYHIEDLMAINSSHQFLPLIYLYTSILKFPQRYQYFIFAIHLLALSSFLQELQDQQTASSVLPQSTQRWLEGSYLDSWECREKKCSSEILSQETCVLSCTCAG